MLSSPTIGQSVQVWYRAVGKPGKRYRSPSRDGMPLHGQAGVVEIVSRGKPRNHGVRIGERVYTVPAGNLRKADS